MTTNMLSLNNLKPNKGSTKKRKRVGRGNASGHGTYATRGLKGQKSRSGVTNLKRLGMKKMLLNLPKVRGFKSPKPKNQTINLFDLNKYFKDGAKISPKTLVAVGLIEDANAIVKVLGQGQLKVKKLEFISVKISDGAKAQIEKNGGKIV
jgi:large subunit ribosomal protein L15